MEAFRDSALVVELMPIRVKNKFVFLHHPRTGGSATSAALKSVGGVQVGDGQHDFYQATADELTVCTLRNPYDVLASWFHMSPQYTDMCKFLEEFSHSYFTKKGQLFYFADASDIWLLYDQLQETFNLLLSAMGMKETRIYRINTTPGKKPFMDYFTPEAVSIVETKFARDLELYQSLLRLEA